MQTKREDDELLKREHITSIISTPAPAQRKGIYHQIIASSAVLLLAMACGLPIGFSAVILPQLFNANATSVTKEIAINIEMGSWIASVHSLATPFGSAISGPLADYFGRRNTLIFATLPMIIGWCVLAIAQSFPFLVLGRIICGFATGLLGGPAQVYIAETAEPNLRGLLIGAPFVFYSVGILLIYAFGAVLHWRIVAWCSIVLPFLSIFALFAIPESPAWLVRQGKMQQAKKALKYLRADESVAEQEVKTMTERLTEERQTSQVNENVFQLCCQREAYKPIIIMFVMSQLQMLSGTFIIVFYAADFISDFEDKIVIKNAVIWTAIVRTACTLLFCCVLLVVRRRKIITISGIGSGVACLILSVFSYVYTNGGMSNTQLYIKGFCLLLYIAFNTPIMIIPGVMIGELLPARVRGRAAGALFASMNVSLFLLSKCFPFIQRAINLSGVFLLFSISNFAIVIFMYLFQPETKGRNLNQIEDYFKEKNWLWYKRDKAYKQVQQIEKA